MDDLTPAEMLMMEVADNLATLTEHAMESIAKPPRGSASEVGHYRVLNSSLKRKELDALQQVLDELAYNVAATIFATLDGAIESELPDFPSLALVERESGAPIAESLHRAFAQIWEDEENDQDHDTEVPHPS
jgi:hypothetical protein